MHNRSQMDDLKSRFLPASWDLRAIFARSDFFKDFDVLASENRKSWASNGHFLHVACPGGPAGASALLNFFPRNPPAYFLMIPLLNAREQVYSQTTVQTMYSIPYRIILPAWKYRYPTICIPVSIPYGRAIIILNPLPTSLIERLDNLKSYYNYNYSYIPW